MTSPKQLTYRGKTGSIAGWARELGLNVGTLRSRLRRSGDSITKALELPVIPHHNQNSRKGRTQAYSSWAKMIARCNNPNASEYPWYGGRGVRVCDRWLDFRKFYEDMGERPPGTSLDKYPADVMEYCKENCRWATRQQQAINQRKPKSGISSKYKGVRKNHAGRWTAQIGFNGTQKYLGSFSTEEAAAKAYDKGATLLYGEDAFLNFKEIKGESK